MNDSLAPSAPGIDDLVRALLGFTLVVAAVGFMADVTHLVSTIRSSPITQGAFLLSHLIVLAHLGGGLLLISRRARGADRAATPVMGATSHPAPRGAPETRRRGSTRPHERSAHSFDGDRLRRLIELTPVDAAALGSPGCNGGT